MSYKYCSLFAFCLFCAQMIHAIIVRNWGEECFYDEHCSDFRMICADDGTIVGIKRCLCDSLHVWSPQLKTCVPHYNTSEMLASIHQRYHTAEWVDANIIKIFTGAIVAGIFVIVMSCFAMLVVFAYCFRIRKSDKRLKELVDLLRAEQQRKMYPKMATKMQKDIPQIIIT